MKTFDLNCDLGDSPDPHIFESAIKMLPYINSCNIACGMHGASMHHIGLYIQNAIKTRIKIGAHPSYPDRNGYGREYVQISASELKSTVKSQILNIKAMVEIEGGKLSHIKPHGALYNRISENHSEAIPVLQAISEIDRDLPIIGLAGSKLNDWVNHSKMNFIPEAFADRRYQANGKLCPRSEKGAVITDPALAKAQVLSIINDSKIKSIEGKNITISARTICIHSDNPSAIEIAKVIHQALSNK